MDEQLVGPTADAPSLGAIAGAIVVEHGQGGVNGDDFVGAIALDQIDLKNGFRFAHRLLAGVATLLGAVALAPVLEGIGIKIFGGKIAIDVDAPGIGAGGAGLEKGIRVGGGGDDNDAIFEGIGFLGGDPIEVIDNVEAEFDGGDLVPVDTAEDESAVLGRDVFFFPIDFPGEGMPVDGFAHREPIVLLTSHFPPLVFVKVLLEVWQYFLRAGERTVFLGGGVGFGGVLLGSEQDQKSAINAMVMTFKITPCFPVALV